LQVNEKQYLKMYHFRKTCINIENSFEELTENLFKI
jgi:hypothetical protein